MDSTILVLCLSSFLAGAVNAVAGGGTLLTFPALVAALGATDVAKVLATGTSTVALVPGSLGAIWAYRREFPSLRRWIRLLLPVSVIGGGIGAAAVVIFPARWFATLVPWLILVATLLFAFQRRIAQWAGIGKEHESATTRTRVLIVVFQLLVAIYGGYFGAGIGILMLAALAMLGLSDIHSMNGLKSLLATGINAIASLIFIVENKVHWRYALLMAATAMLGGFVGGSFAQKVNRDRVRQTVVLIGLSLASYYFYGEWAQQRETPKASSSSAGDVGLDRGLDLPAADAPPRFALRASGG